MARVVDWRCSKCGEIFARDKRVMRLAEETYCLKCRRERLLGQIAVIGEPRRKLVIGIFSLMPPNYAAVADWNFRVESDPEGMIVQGALGKEVRDYAVAMARTRALEEAERRGWGDVEIEIWVHGVKETR